MRILIINYEFPPLGGGGGAFSKDLAIGLSGNNEVDILTTGYTGLPKQERSDNINIHRIPVMFRKSLYEASVPSMLSFPLPALLKGLLLFKQKKYDIINTHFAIPSGPAGLLLSYMTKTPNIVSVHGSDIYNPAARFSPHKTLLLKQAVRKVLRTADRVIAQSNDMRSCIAEYYRDPGNIEIVPLALPDTTIEQLSEKIPFIREKGIKLVSIGRMAKVKGYDLLIRSIAILSEKLPDIELKLIGDGPERGHLESLTAELELSERITFTGWLTGSDKYKELLDSDIYVMSSLHEGFGVVLLEAMACGLPIVATDTGGQTDIVKNDINGLLCASGNEKKLADSLYSLALDKKKREAISANNKKDIHNYKLSRAAEKYAELFRDTVKHRR